MRISESKRPAGVSACDRFEPIDGDGFSRAAWRRMPATAGLPRRVLKALSGLIDCDRAIAEIGSLELVNLAGSTSYYQGGCNERDAARGLWTSCQVHNSHAATVNKT